MNKLGQEYRPFLFVISYAMASNLVIPLEELEESEVRFDFSGKRKTLKHNLPPKSPPLLESRLASSNNWLQDNRNTIPTEVFLNPQKIDFELYKKAFDKVKENLLAGNSFLTNLTVSTPVSPTINLQEIYQNTHAKYKLWIKDKLVCFSPETFVTVSEDGEIATYPMKGTIDASIPDAENRIKSDKKELYEHTTIVDLLRNDLSKIAGKIRVERFQYTDKIKKEDGTEILQMSSEIRGQLPKNWKATLGNWFFELLPAGSICGAPKAKTLEIIQEAEKDLHLNGNRDFYTGVFGVFDGKTLTSAVMIRFIEKTDNGHIFKSGGGITHLSDAMKEYEEIYQKLYVPVG